MSNSARQNEKRRQRDEENNKRWNEEAAERRRKEALTMYERIEECCVYPVRVADLKEILHIFAQKLGLEE